MGVAALGRSSIGGSGGMPSRNFLNFEPAESGSEALSYNVLAKNLSAIS